MVGAGSQEEKIVTIFGGAKCTEGAEEYRQAEKLGEALAQAGFTVCTGGYQGIMEAASRGARRVGGRVVGITMNQFSAKPNEYLTDSEAADHFYERLEKLITRSVGFVALRGGMGTVTEVSLVWNKLTTRVMPARPLVLIGDCWRGLIDACQTHLVVSSEDVGHLHFAADADEAASIILKHS